MRLLSILVTCFVCCFSMLLAQTPLCRVQPNGVELERFNSNLRASFGQPRTDQYVPLRFVLLEEHHSQDSYNIADLYGAVCRTNQIYDGSGLQFWIKEVIYASVVDWGDELENASDYFTVLSLYEDTTALNVLLAEAVDLRQQLGGQGTSTIGGNQIILYREFCQEQSFGLAHMLGHIFTLPHAYSGWSDLALWNYYEYVDTSGLTPTQPPTGLALEWANGSNCTTTGDMICDTPPDYHFGIIPDACDREYHILDPNGDTILWQPGNIMGSFYECPVERYHMSEMQQAVVWNEYQQADRQALREHSQPEVLSLSGTTNPLRTSSGDGPMIPGDSLLWNPVEGATSYLVEISLDLERDFYQDRRQWLVHGETHFVLPTDDYPSGSTISRAYEWRVTPYGPVGNCELTGQSDIEEIDLSVVTASGTYSEYQRAEIIPNPVSVGKQATLLLDWGQASIVCELTIYTAQGMQLHSWSERIEEGQQLLNIPPLSAGVYWLRMQSQEGELKSLCWVVQ